MTEKHSILRGSIHLQKPSLIFFMYLNTIVKPKKLSNDLPKYGRSLPWWKCTSFEN
jgi:hypothetical protein